MMKTLMASSLDLGQRYWRDALLVLALALAVYAAWPRTATSNATPAATTGTDSGPGWSRVCVAGVAYLQFTSGASVEWTPAGRVRSCGATAAK
jgi:hypothetical protein